MPAALSEAGCSVAEVARQLGGRVSLTRGEQLRIREELQNIVASTEIVREHLFIAALRQEAEPSSWSTKRLDEIVGAARGLIKAVFYVPVVDA